MKASLFLTLGFLSSAVISCPGHEAAHEQRNVRRHEAQAAPHHLEARATTIKTSTKASSTKKTSSTKTSSVKTSSVKTSSVKTTSTKVSSSSVVVSSSSVALPTASASAAAV